MREWRDLIFRISTSPELTHHRYISLVEFDADCGCRTLVILEFSEYERREGLPVPGQLELFLGHGFELSAMLDEFASAPGLRDWDRETLQQTREHWLPISYSSRRRLYRYKYFADLLAGREELEEYRQTANEGSFLQAHEQMGSMLMKLNRICYDVISLRERFRVFQIFDATLRAARPKKSDDSTVDQTKLTA